MSEKTNEWAREKFDETIDGAFSGDALILVHQAQGYYLALNIAKDKRRAELEDQIARMKKCVNHYPETKELWRLTDSGEYRKGDWK